MAAFLGVGDFVKVDEDAAFLHASKLMVDCCAEHAHSGREAHVGTDERRNVDILAADVAVEEQVVFLEIIAFEKRRQILHVANVEWRDGSHQFFMVREIEMQESEQQVAAVNGIVGVHRHLAKEVLDFRMDDGEGSEPIPQVVEGKDAFSANFTRLVFGPYKRSPQLNGIGQVVVKKLLREMKHVRHGDAWCSIFVEPHVLAHDIPVGAYNHLFIGVPHQQLLACRLHKVELVDVAVLACAASRLPKRYLAQATYLAHGIWRVVGVDDIYLVAGLVGLSQQSLRRQLLDD